MHACLPRTSFLGRVYLILLLPKPKAKASALILALLYTLPPHGGRGLNPCPCPDPCLCRRERGALGTSPVARFASRISSRSQGWGERPQLAAPRGLPALRGAAAVAEGRWGPPGWVGAPHNPRGAEPHSQCPASCGTSAAGARAAAWGWGRPLLPELLQHHGSVHRGCHGTAVRYKLGKYLRRGGLRGWVPGVDAAPRPRGSWCLKERPPLQARPSSPLALLVSLPLFQGCMSPIYTHVYLLSLLLGCAPTSERAARRWWRRAAGRRGHPAPNPPPGPQLLAGGAGAAVGPGCAARMGMGFPGRICIFAVPAAGCLRLAPAGQCLCAPASRSRCLFALFNC